MSLRSPLAQSTVLQTSLQRLKLEDQNTGSFDLRNITSGGQCETDGGKQAYSLNL